MRSTQSFAPSSPAEALCNSLDCLCIFSIFPQPAGVKEFGFRQAKAGRRADLAQVGHGSVRQHVNPYSIARRLRVDSAYDIVYNTNSEGDDAVTQKDKLLRKMKNNPRDFGFEDIYKYLTQKGATVRQGGGSHWVFTLNGKHVAIPRDNPVRAIYVKLAFDMVEGETNHDKDTE